MKAVRECEETVLDTGKRETSRERCGRTMPIPPGTAVGSRRTLAAILLVICVVASPVLMVIPGLDAAGSTATADLAMEAGHPGNARPSHRSSDSIPGFLGPASSGSGMTAQELLSNALPATREYSYHLATEEDIDDLRLKTGVREPGRDYNLIVNGHGTGAAPPTEEELTSLIGKLKIVEGVSDPPPRASMDLSQDAYFPPVGDQGLQGSCTAWSVSYYANGYLQAKDKNWTDASSGNEDHLMSPAWVYNKVNHGYDSGSSKVYNMDLIQSVGNAVWSTMPYDQDDHTSWGDEGAWRSAPEYRIGAYESTDSSNTNVIKSWVDEGYPAPIALDAGEYNDGLGTGDDTISSLEYTPGGPNHANTIIGYDDDKGEDGDIGAFKVVNSWGSDWGAEWGGYGYFWMTYDALAELIRPVWRFYDVEGYNPSLLAVWSLNPQGNRDAEVVLGVGPYGSPDDTRTPVWDGGSHDFPPFMGLDITEFEDELNAGVSDFFLWIGSGSPSSTMISFKIEKYEGQYAPGLPALVSGESPDVPETTPGYVTNSFVALLTIDNPPDDSLVRGTVNVTGRAAAQWNTVILEEGFEGIFTGPWIMGDSNASSDEDYWGVSGYRSSSGISSAWAAATGDKRVTETVFEEDFEGSTPSSWIVGDSDASDGEDYWGVTDHKSSGGNKSSWSAQVGVDSRMLFSEDFNNGGSLPTGWVTYSEGPDIHEWEMKLDSGSDYRAECNSDEAGSGTDITEWLYTTAGTDASSYTSLTLQFYLNYNHYDGDEYARVLYATSLSYPTFYELETWYSDTTGTESLDLSVAAGDPEVYLAFVYHGTYDWYMRVDNVVVYGIVPNSETHEYDDNMYAYMYKSVDLSAYDIAVLAYDYWLDSELSYDYLFSIYYDQSSWHFEGDLTGNSGGWQTANTTLPTTATHFGFHFYADGSVHDYEGAYIDNITVEGTRIEPNSVSRTYDDNMSAYMYMAVNLSGLDSATLSYKYWLDAEDSFDYLYVLYYDSDWYFVDPHTGTSSGWETSNVSIPSSATHVGFFFDSDASVHDYEGAYVDDVVLFDSDNFTGVFVKIDNGSWNPASGGQDWYYEWNTTGYSDGAHQLYARAYFGSRYYECSRTVTVDNTPPDNPTGYSSTHTPNTWSNDDTIWIGWFNAHDATSGVSGYSFDWTTLPDTLPDDSLDTTGASTTSSPLSDGNSWFFHVRTVDNVGNWAVDAFHVGPFFIDTVLPSNPDSYSSSHTPYIWSNDSTILIQWSGATDDLSGVYGFSFYWDKSASTVPDQTVETLGNGTNSPPLPDDNSLYFHVRAVDLAGNWAVGAFSAGPFYIDTESPSTDCVLSGTEGYDNWYISNVTVEIVSSDALSGVNSTEYRIDGGPWQDYVGDFVLSSDSIYSIEFHSEDNARNRDDIGSAEVKIDRTPPLNPDSYSSSHTVGMWSNDSTVFVEWHGAFDNMSGVHGFSLVWDTIPSTLPDAVEDTVLPNTTSPGLGDGDSWYLHVRTRDVAGNWAPDAFHIGPFMIDTTMPQPGTEFHAELEGSSWEDVNLSWTPSPEDPAELLRYDIYYGTQYDADGIGYTVLASVPIGTTNHVHENAGLGDSNCYFYVLSVVDVAGNSVAYADQVSKFIRSLQTGWQLLSIPLVQSDFSLVSVFRTVDFEQVRYYDSSDPSDGWKSYHRSKAYGDLDEVTLSTGLWIDVTSDSDLVIAGVIPQSTTVLLRKGWNLVGFPSFSENIIVADLKDSLGAVRVEGYDASMSPHYLRLLTDTDILLAGHAYWIEVEASVWWTLVND